MSDPNAKRDKALERQAAALDEISKTLKSLLRIHTVLNQNIVSLGEFIKDRQDEIQSPSDEALAHYRGLLSESDALTAPPMQVETSRIPVRLMGEQSALIGWAEKAVGEDPINFTLTSEWLVDAVESLESTDQIVGLFVGIEYREAKDANDGGDTNAAE